MAFPANAEMQTFCEIKMHDTQFIPRIFISGRHVISSKHILLFVTAHAVYFYDFIRLHKFVTTTH